MSTPTFDDPEMKEIFEGYLVETRELLDNLAQDLMEIENDPENLDLLNRIFRSAHTIKGTSSFMGFEKITEITHHGEDILNKLRKGELKVTLPIIDVLLEVHDIIEKLVNNLVEGGEDIDFQKTIKKIEILKNPDATEEDIAAIENEFADKSTEEIPSTTDQPIIEKNEHLESESQTKPEKALDAVLSDPSITKGKGDFSDDELELIQAAFAEINSELATDVTVPEKKEDNQAKVSDTKTQKEIINEKPVDEEKVITETSKIEEKKPQKSETYNIQTTTETHKQIQQETQKPKPTTKEIPKTDDKKMPNAHETIRVDVDRVEALMDLSGELVLGRNRLAQITENIGRVMENKDLLRDLNETTASIDFITTEIQAAVMRMRMVPVGKLYQKAPRIVRDLSKEFNKKIRLVVKGEETEIDRGIIEELNDPLVHMIRNSCDHGIETVEERKKIGKPEIGTITLDAYQEGNNIVLQIIDDGRGMDPEKLKAKAIEKGLISEEHASQMSQRETLQLIFQPGFSTAAKVTSVSGRGVGMDVVRSNIQKLKGMVEIESELGKGSKFIIKLPLTLAIIQGLLVRVYDETYALPLSSVEEVVSIDLSSVSHINQQEVIKIRQNVLPLVRLDKTLNSKEIKESLDNRYVVVVGLGIYRIGLVVDELLGQQEIVIKSIGEYLGKIKGIAGSTILGDGRVIMIIDVAELVEQNEKKQYLEQ